MQRRTFVRNALGLLGLSATGGVLAACSPKGSEKATTVAPEAPPPFKDLVAELERRGDFGLQVFQGASEFIVGGPQRIPLRLDDAEMTVESGAARLWLGRARSVTGPVDLDFKPFKTGKTDELSSGGYWEATSPMPGTGVVDLAVELTRRGETLYGFTVIEARSTPVVPAVKEEAIRVATPTEGEPLDSSTLCTREPPCDMHGTSLDNALGTGRPVVLAIGSPKLCSSGVCGPVLEEVLVLKASGIDAHFIHVEPYRSNTATELTAAASAWRLPSEPWTFIIDRSSRVAARFEGPVTASTLEAAYANM